MKEFSSNHPWCLFRGTSKSHLGEKGRTIIFQKCWLLVGYVAFRPTILSFARRPTLRVVAKSPPCGETRRFRRFRFFVVRSVQAHKGNGTLKPHEGVFSTRGKQSATRFALQRGSSGNCLEIEKPAVHLAVSDVCHIPAQGPVRWLHVIWFLCA